ncbi:helix-turn-helix transcriptional regulator [Curtobacterium pusillum]|uniref:helix-turn-helix transcriptional regulator n=1 Tax=Curtobacterium pusillum TaxID=69373 RepID=UPI0038120E58
MVRRLFAFRRRHGERTGRDPARSPADRDLERVAAIARFAVERFRDQISAGDAARAANITTPYAMTMFRRVVGMTIGDYIVQCRIAEARRLLSTTGNPVAEVAHLSGFGSQSSFYAHFSKHCGATPKEYRAGFGAD